MNESSKLASRRDVWKDKYLVGKGIDIGCGQDPVTIDCDLWDMVDGDAQLLKGIDAAKYDWVYSSHCLEHLRDPSVGLARWWEILKPKGHLIVIVPDEDLYEQGVWPSNLNADHKTTWTIHKTESWSEVCHSLAQELALLPACQIRSLTLIDDGYNYDLHRRVRGSFVMPPEMGRAIQDSQKLTPEILGQTSLDLCGFWLIDQSCDGAQVSIEAIARKLR